MTTMQMTAASRRDGSWKALSFKPTVYRNCLRFQRWCFIFVSMQSEVSDTLSSSHSGLVSFVNEALAVVSNGVNMEKRSSFETLLVCYIILHIINDFVPSGRVKVSIFCSVSFTPPPLNASCSHLIPAAVQRCVLLWGRIRLDADRWRGNLFVSVLHAHLGSKYKI